MDDLANLWRKVDRLLKSAVLSNDTCERKRLIDEAMALRAKALELERTEAGQGHAERKPS